MDKEQAIRRAQKLMADAFHAYGPPKNPAKSCPRWFQFISTGVANYTDSLAGDQVRFAKPIKSPKDIQSPEAIRMHEVFRCAQQTREKSALATRRFRGVGGRNRSGSIGCHE